MNILLITNPLPGRDFRRELRFPLLAASFFRKLYPNGRCILATAGRMPNDFPSRDFDVIQYPFTSGPHALMRVKFWNYFVNSKNFDDDTVLAGHDVVFCKKIPLPADAAIVTNYRYHPSQPYCSDLIVLKKRHQTDAQLFFSELLEAHRWMPGAILDGAADQLALMTVMGMPEKKMFNGNCLATPRKPWVRALPVDPFFYTPGDIFPSDYERFTGSPLPTQASDLNCFSLWDSKYSLHFKGNRKESMIKFGHWAWRNSFIDINFGGYAADEVFV